MKAIRVHENGGPEVLKYEQIEIPEPGKGEARVRIEASGVNFIDIYQRMGSYAGELPFIPGMEGAGTIDAIGPGVEGLEPGDRVAYTLHKGSYAEFAIVPAQKLVRVPEKVDSQLAAGVMLQGMTAHYLSHSTYPLRQGETALIHAASGGVGHLLVQMAKKRGARVIATTSTQEKAEIARQMGADQVIIYSETDFEQAVRNLTDGQGVDVVYDSVGKDTFDKSLNCLKPRGYMVLYGQSSGPVEPVDPQTLNAKGSLYLTRPTLGNYIAEHDELTGRVKDLFDWIARRELDVRIDRVMPLSDAAEAHRYMENRRTKGKLLLVPEEIA